jgi:preprotein translocase subunit SecG
MLYYLVSILYVLVCFVLMLVILLQQGKGGDIASAFGGGASQAAFGARSGATVLSRATTIFAVLFVLGALVLGIIGQRGPTSVLGGRGAQNPLQQPSTPALPGQPTGPVSTQQPAAPQPAQPSAPPPSTPAAPQR